MSKSEIQVEKKNVESQKSESKTKSQDKARNPKITEELVERALSGKGHSSEIKALVEKVSKGPILTKENKAIEI